MFKYLNHLVISKFVMAATGAFIVLFITGHAIGNLQIFLGKDALNTYAAFLQSLGEILWAERIVLGLAFVLHIITSIYLKLYNNKVRPTKYAVTKYIKARFSSRTMIWTGIMIGSFLVFHILHFTSRDIDPKYKEMHEVYQDEHASYFGFDETVMQATNAEDLGIGLHPIIKQRHDTYAMVVDGFQNIWISLFYILAVILLGFHLSHAIQSMFQTLGINGPRFTPLMIKISNAYGIFIALAFAIVPLSVLLGFIGRGL